MRVASLFSGAGGLDLGFVQAGHDIVWAVDNFADAVETYRRNVGEHVVSTDIRDVDIDSVPDFDLLIGGFPCQGFSIANMNRSTEDGRNLLYLEFLRFLRTRQPYYFVAENVKGILSLGGGEVMNGIVADFERAGYDVKWKVLNAADFGVPQLRQRVFFLGRRHDVLPEVDHPSPSHFPPDRPSLFGSQTWVSVGEALREIPDPDGPHLLANHTYSKYKLRFNGYLGHRVIDSNRPAPTVTARGDERGGVVVLHHPNNHRRMSARELATVQGFPLDFVFAGPQSSAYRQIGNAVPPPLARAVAAVFPLSTDKLVTHIDAAAR